MAVSTKRFTLTRQAYQDISEGNAFCSFRLLYLSQANNSVRIVLGSSLPDPDTVHYDSFRAPREGKDSSNETHAHFPGCLSDTYRAYARADGADMHLTVYRM